MERGCSKRRSCCDAVVSAELEDFVLAAEITEGAYVGDDEGGGEAVFCADLAEVDAAVFEGEAAAIAVVADLDELALEGFVGEVVADAGGEVEAFASEVAVAEEGADLIGERLFEGDEIRRRRVAGEIAWTGLSLRRK